MKLNDKALQEHLEFLANRFDELPDWMKIEFIKDMTKLIYYEYPDDEP